MPGLTELYKRAETNADSVEDTITELNILFQGRHYFNQEIINSKCVGIQEVDINEELDVLMRMEQITKTMQKLLKAEQTRRRYQTEISEKEQQTNTRENIQNERKERRKNRACPYSRVSAGPNGVGF